MEEKKIKTSPSREDGEGDPEGTIVTAGPLPDSGLHPEKKSRTRLFQDLRKGFAGRKRGWWVVRVCGTNLVARRGE